jgi:hypothetical protein
LNIQLELRPKAVKMYILAYILFLPTIDQSLLVLRTMTAENMNKELRWK